MTIPTAFTPSFHARMGTVYAIANQKGGVGKTTTAVNLGACAAGGGHRTLLVDMDPQCNATVGLGLAKDLEPNIYDCLAGDAKLPDAARATAVRDLEVVPATPRSPTFCAAPPGTGRRRAPPGAPGARARGAAPATPDLAGANVELPRLPGSETRLRDALGDVRERYQLTLLDCPPALGPLTVNALVAADRVLVPVQAEYYALEGMAGLLDTVSLIQREMNPRLTIAGMVITMHDGRTRLAEDVERELRQHFPELVFDTVIPRNVRVGEAPSFGVPVTLHDPQCA